MWEQADQINTKKYLQGQSDQILNKEDDSSKLRRGGRLQGRHEGGGHEADQQRDQCLKDCLNQIKEGRSIETKTMSYAFVIMILIS